MDKRVSHLSKQKTLEPQAPRNVDKKSAGQEMFSCRPKYSFKNTKNTVKSLWIWKEIV